MARSSIFVGQDIPGVEGLAKQQAALARLPEGIMAEVGPAIALAALRICETQKSICPVNDLDPTPGALKDSGHVENIESASGVAKEIVFDAVDEKGRPYAKHVEHGHKSEDGKHVAPVPFFWPGYNHEKKAAKALVNRAMNKAVKARFSANGG